MLLLRLIAICTLGAALSMPSARAYSVLTHQAIIDIEWEPTLAPLVRARFPQITPDQLQQARAYAYGGCIIQDMGYYPFGSKFFTDLAHYVRSGDFVLALLREAQDANEFAFALGALAHYAADTNGHAFGVNRAVPLLYPKLRARYGDVVTYEDDPSAHLKTEFAFDVVQAAAGNYASNTYHRFIGFQVSKPVLERAFRETYGLNLEDLFTSLDLALGTYRFTVSRIAPEATRVAWAIQKDEILKAHPGITRRQFIYRRMSRAAYRKEFGAGYRHPSLLARCLAVLFRIVPKVGPFRSLSFPPPTPAAGKDFRNSFTRTLDLYAALVPAAGGRTVALADINLDTGHVTPPGKYRRADETYADLLCRLSKNNFQGLNEGLRANLLAFFAQPQGTNKVQRNPKQWQKTMQALAKLRALPEVPSAASSAGK